MFADERRQLILELAPGVRPPARRLGWFDELVTNSLLVAQAPAGSRGIDVVMTGGRPW